MIFEICLAAVVFLVIAKTWSSRKKKRICYPIATENFEYDVAVVGSGILGSVMAAVLGRDGRKVVVIERNLEMPERFVGELMQPGGMIVLKKLGLSECMEGIEAQHCIGYTLHHKKEGRIPLTFPSGAEKGFTMNNGRFMMNLRKAAMSERNVTYIEANVTDLIEKDNIVTGVICKAKDEDEERKIKAKLTVVADGCFSSLRKRLINDKPKHLSYFIATEKPTASKVEFNSIEVVITDTSPVIFYQIADDVSRIIVDLKGSEVQKDLRSYFRETIHPKLPENLKEPFLQATESGRIRMMPNQLLPQLPNDKIGVLALGDALNIRHAITAGGMTVGLLDIIILRKFLSEIKDLSDYKKVSDVVKDFYGKRRWGHSFAVNMLSVVMYEVLAATDEWMIHLQRACLRYFKIGGMCHDGPVEILAVLKSGVHLVFFHFILILLYALYLSFVDNFPFSLHRWLYESVRIVGRFLSVALPLIWSEIKTIF